MIVTRGLAQNRKELLKKGTKEGNKGRKTKEDTMEGKTERQGKTEAKKANEGRMWRKRLTGVVM